jgi:acyl-CoA synthetase (AMP-forming)/AMP-acid ligase II
VSASRTIVDVLRAQASRSPDRGYVRVDAPAGAVAQLTFPDLDRRACAIAGWLRGEMHVAKGTPVLLAFPQGLEFIAALFGCIYAGAVPVPVPPPEPQRLARTLPRLTQVIRSSGASLLLTSPDLTGPVEAGLADTGLRVAAPPDRDPDGVSRFEPDARPDDIAFLQFSSGSTSAPQGVPVRHSSLLANLEQLRRAVGASDATTILSWVPFYHDMGLVGGVFNIATLPAGGYIMSPLTFLYRPIRWLRAISDLRVTMSSGPNFAFDLCVRRTTPEERGGLDLSAWERVVCGGEPISYRTMRRFEEAFAPAGLRPGVLAPCYGLAEVTLFASGGPPGRGLSHLSVDHERLGEQRAGDDADDPGTSTVVGCGKPAEGSTLLIVDPDSRRPVDEGRVGEIWIAGPHVALGYWGQPEQSSETFGAALADGRGPFVRTGDLGFMRSGELFVTGRIKDLIIIAGKNYYPQDIEWTVERAHPSVRPGCVVAFAVPTERGEQLAIVAEIERRHLGRALEVDPQHAPTDPGAFDPQEIFRSLTEAVAYHHDLRIGALALVRAGSIAKTTSGKLQRAACRTSFAVGELPILARYP